MSRVKQYRWWEFTARAIAIGAVTVWYGSVFLVRRWLGASEMLTYTIFPRWARAVLRAAGVHVQVHGADLLPVATPMILVANHCSLFDIPVLMVASPVPLRILYKRELERVPFLGWALKHSTFIPVERERPQTAGRTIHQAVDLLAQDPAALVIFPEGTRSRTGEVGPFRRGAFALAFATGRVIIPVALGGTSAILPPTTLRFNGGTVTVKFLDATFPPPLESRAQERAWIDQLRSIIVAAIEG